LLLLTDGIGCSHVLWNTYELFGGLEVEEVEILKFVILGGLENVDGDAVRVAVLVCGVEEIEKKLYMSVIWTRMGVLLFGLHTFSHLKTISISCDESARCWDSLSESGGTRSDSIVANTSFHNRVMTIIMAESVKVSFMIAKFALKYSNSGFKAFVTSCCVGAADIDCGRFFWKKLVTVETLIPRLSIARKAPRDNVWWM
jgi:hypothetical protein